jgi:hypothetical protein
VQDGRVTSHEAVRVGVHQHLVVKAVDRVVERGLMLPDLSVAAVSKRLEEREGVADLGCKGALADAFFLAAAGYSAAGRVAQQ